MPTYSYKCSSCGHQLEVVQRMSEDALKDCPDCQAPTLVKQIQAVGFALKGTGWYVTDFRDKGKAAKKTEDDAPAKTETTGESKSETKPDTKSDTKSETKSDSQSDTKTETKSEPKTESKPAASSPET